MMQPSLFITGGTGMIGKGLVDLFLKKSSFHIYLLTHTTSQCSRPGHSDFERLHLVQGDIRHPRLGMGEATYRELGMTITHVMHAAATTRFDLPIEQARSTNVDGTAHVLDFARQCRHLNQFGLISTAYVSGKRTGLVYEKERGHDRGFVNSYEQSKYEAEAVLEAEAGAIPAAIYRLSTVIGDSHTGEVRHFTAPHQALRIIHLGLAAMVPGTPDYSVDLIPSDYATATVYELFLNHFEPGQRFHITAGREKSYALQELIDESYRFLEEDPRWKQRSYPRPVIASADAFDLFMESVERANNPIVLGVLRALKHFAHQLNYPKEFDHANLLACLPRSDEALPDIRQYYRKVVHYCVHSDWGRHEPTTTHHGTAVKIS